MKNTGGDDWRVLCEMASKEMDPKKLLALITKINKVLAAFREKPRSALSANSHL